MKPILIVVLAVLIAACHEAPVKCDGHLTPINQVAKASSSQAQSGASTPTGEAHLR